MIGKEKKEYFKKKLEEEKILLEKELSGVGENNPDIKGDWQTTVADMDVVTSDMNELADAAEEMENRTAIENSLEGRLEDVNNALKRIQIGEYGVCVTCGEVIDEKRLEANPAAIKCVKHA